MKDLLTRNECTAMRGIAILAIMLHNYCHFIGKVVKENEYQFFTSNNDRLWQVVSHPDELLPVHLLSYFGHYGVPVFLFLSGYGLVRKYETSHDSCPPVRFVRYSYLKLLRMLIVGFSLFICVDMVTPGRFPFHWDNVLAQLLMYINVLPEPDKTIWPGIYWFFGLMMELYIVYRLLLYRRNSWFVVGLVAVCWLLQVFCDPDGDDLFLHLCHIKRSSGKQDHDHGEIPGTCRRGSDIRPFDRTYLLLQRHAKLPHGKRASGAAQRTAERIL